MFTDRAVIIIRSGSGGHGAVSFRREKYIAAGGPDGGDGGRGGSVIFSVDKGINTLLDFRYRRKFAAANGGDGGKNRMTGKNGGSVVIRVPAGTIVKDSKTGRVLCDLTEEEDTFVALEGGRGGKGNCRFATATRQVPNFATAGEKGRELEVVLELKLLADVGLAGFPNVGKSTLLSATTAAKPEIADYPFTTVNPQRGVVKTRDGGSFVMADIPGLIEGASEGRGIGHRFLRHIERTRLILHVVDISGSEGRDPFNDFLLINEELKKYDPRLYERPQIVAANKSDLTLTDDAFDDFVKKFEGWLSERRLDGTQDRCAEEGFYRVFKISAAAGQGVAELMDYCGSLLKLLPRSPSFEDEIEDAGEFGAEEEALYDVTMDGDVYVVSGRWVEHLLDSVNFADSESMQYFQRSLRQSGVIDRLTEMGVKEDDTVRIGDTEFDFAF